MNSKFLLFSLLIFGILFVSADPLLCQKTYDYRMNYGVDYSNLTNFMNTLPNNSIYNSKDIVADYIQNWQSLCSDEVGKSLNPQVICKEIQNNQQPNLYESDLNLMQREINNSVKVSQNLLIKYFLNYEENCIDLNYSEPLKGKVILNINGQIKTLTSKKSIFDYSLGNFNFVVGRMGDLLYEGLNLGLTFEESDGIYTLEGIKYSFLVFLILIFIFMRWVKNRTK